MTSATNSDKPDDRIYVTREQAEVLKASMRECLKREPTEYEHKRAISYVLVALETERLAGETLESGLAHNLLAGHCAISFDANNEPRFQMTAAGRKHIEGVMRSKGLNPDDFKRKA